MFVVVGPLDTPGAARLLHVLRDGEVLGAAVGGETRHDVPRGTFAASSELVGCASKARDGRIGPSVGLPVARAPRPTAPNPGADTPATPAAVAARTSPPPPKPPT